MPKGLWRKPDAIRCWAARRTEAGPDAGEPLVCVASVLGHVDEATGKRMIRMMLASGAKPDVPDGNGMFPEEAARRSGTSAELLRLLAAPPAEWTQGTDDASQQDKQAPRRPDPRLGVSTAAQRGKPDDTKMKRFRVRQKPDTEPFRFERVKREYGPKGGKAFPGEQRTRRFASRRERPSTA